MPDPISFQDSMIGSRFWLDTNLSTAAANAATGLQDAQAPTEKQLAKVKHDSAVFNFVNAGGDGLAKSAINQAELFAASHTLSETERDIEANRANRNAATLVGDAIAVDDFLADAAGDFDGDAATVRTAFTKLMASREFTERTALGQPLGEAGRASLKNAVLGLATMLRDGQISENAALVLADGNLYDAANRSDLLRLAADSAKKVKELFVGKERFDALLEQCRSLLKDCPPEARAGLQEKIADLEQLAQQAVNLRQAAVSGLKTDYLFTDPTGKTKNDAKFQKRQLDEIRDSLRAFRYDLDQARGVGMGTMERMRRYFDEKRSSFAGPRIDRAAWARMQEADDTFNTLLAEIRRETAATRLAAQRPGEEISLVPLGPSLKPDDIYGGVSAAVAGEDCADLNAAAEAATHLSHLTNDRIRYHYSGAEKRIEANAEAMRAELGDIAKRGGSRNVTLRAGADALFGLDIGFAEADVKAGGTIQIGAKISCSKAGGPVEVTYSYGVEGHVKATAALGVDPKADAGAGGGLGAKATAGLSGNGRRSVTKTYASLDEFIKTASRLNLVMTPRPLEMFLAYGKAAVKGVGHLFTLGATALGFRIHRSRMDQVAYSQELRNRNVFGPLGGIFLAKRNVEVLGERTAFSLSGSLSGEVKGGLYVPNAAGDGLVPQVSFGGSVSLGYERELHVRNRTYESFAKSLSGCSEARLQRQLNTMVAAANTAEDAWTADLANATMRGKSGNASALATEVSLLADRLADLEETATGKAHSDTAFWTQFATRARALATVAAVLVKRIEALGDAEEAKAAKAAARAAMEHILPRLANPVVKVPEKIYREKFFNVFDLGKPPVAKTTFNVSVSVNALGDVKDELLGKVKNAKLNNLAETGASFVEANAMLSNAVEVKVTREKPIANAPDVRPWLNSVKTTLDVRLSAGMPVRVIADLVARAYVKSRSGADEMEESTLLDELRDTVTDALKLGAADFALNSLLPSNSNVYGFKDAAFKTLRFSFSNGRFSAFTLTNDYDTEAKLEGKVLPFLSLNLSLASQTSVTDYTVMPKPSANSLMGAAADYFAAGNDEGFRTFLARNRKGVEELVRSAPNGGLDTTLEGCRRHLASLAAGEGDIADRAKEMRASFEALANEITHQDPPLEPDALLDLAARFFTAASQIYTLAAME